jgi:1-deoxy-D-xylulose-5-phosphate reductoisomerase
MRLPIQYALTYPERCSSPVKRLNLAQIKQLQFDAPDFSRFPCLKLALKAGETGGTMPVVMNAANEIAVDAFLKKKIGFADIPLLIEKTMKAHPINNRPSIDTIFSVDEQARKKTKMLIA